MKGCAIVRHVGTSRPMELVVVSGCEVLHRTTSFEPVLYNWYERMQALVLDRHIFCETGAQCLYMDCPNDTSSVAISINPLTSLTIVRFKSFQIRSISSWLIEFLRGRNFDSSLTEAFTEQLVRNSAKKKLREKYQDSHVLAGFDGVVDSANG